MGSLPGQYICPRRITMPEWIIEEPEETGLGANIKRIGAGAGISALKGLESIADIFGGTGLRSASGELEKKFGLTPEYLEPRNLPEQFVQRFAQFAPTAGLLGGLPGLATTAIGSGVGSLAKYAGLPEPVADIAQLGTELASGRYTGRIPSIGQAQKTGYETARSAIKPGSKVQADAINNALKTVESELGTEVGGKTAKKIQHVVKTIGENITQKKIDPKKAMDLRKKLYEESRSLSDSVNKTYIEPLTRGINDFFAHYSAENPTFYKHLKNADKLTELKNMALLSTDYIGKLGLDRLPLGKLASDVSSYVVGETERFARGIAKNPAARKYYFDAITSTVHNDPMLFAHNINKLKSEMPEIFGAEQTSSPSGTPQWIIEE